MAFPKLLQLLFDNGGAGPQLRKDIIPGADDTVTLSGEQTISGAKTFGAPVTAKDSLSVDGAVSAKGGLAVQGGATVSGTITASGTIKGQRLAADNGENTNMDFKDAHGETGWFLSHDNKSSDVWTEIATVNSKVAKAVVADSAKYVEVGQVNGLRIGAKTFSRSATNSGLTFSVQASRDAYGRLSGLAVGTSGAVNCNCNCNCNCDCSDSDTDG